MAYEEFTFVFEPEIKISKSKLKINKNYKIPFKLRIL